MRLINTKSFELSQPYFQNEAPDYVILSHRWGTEEVTFADINTTSLSDLQNPIRKQHGFAKMEGACKLALKDGYQWIWIDSCCIDKSSSAELQEAINSMWRYYAQANICYVYMSDVPDSEAGWGWKFDGSQWFTRAWTLQELISPVYVEFYAKSWEPIGTKFERQEQIARITGIDPEVLVHNQPIRLYNVAQRLSWAAHREATREEDESYSLFGLFDVNLPLLYGEGRTKAFARLQEAIYNATADHSIFLTRYSLHKSSQPLLGDSPRRFCEREHCTQCPSDGVYCFPSHLRYSRLIASERWRTEAHEQIMTGGAMFQSEVSAILSLLNYQYTTTMLEYLDKYHERGTFNKHLNQRTAPFGITHVAVLNYTLDEYPEGALCLLLYRQPEVDACLRLPAMPVVLPQIGGFVPMLSKTRLRVCPGPRFSNLGRTVITIFSLRSRDFRAATWSLDTRSATITSASVEDEGSRFNVIRDVVGDIQEPAAISCHVSRPCSQAPLVSIRFLLKNEIWSIKEISESQVGSEGEKPARLFFCKARTDRCTVGTLDGDLLSIALRRLSSCTRDEPIAVRPISQISYEVLVEYAHK